MLYFTRRRRSCRKLICLGGLSCLTAYLFLATTVIKGKTNLCESMARPDNNTMKYIFNLDHWRELMHQIRNSSSKRQASWCEVPDELQLISNSICRAYNRKDCTYLPCSMVYYTLNTLEDIKCLHGGRVAKNDDKDSVRKEPDRLCKRGFSLDLFLQKSDDCSYPSIIADTLTPFSDELYIDVLNNTFRTYDSIWGLTFNFESIYNYPWTADREKLKLFDVTFGYDRSLYDFIPAPWLFNYVEQLKFNAKRLSTQKAMYYKKPIHSTTSSDIYWTNVPTLHTTREEKINTSYITAPILWMNSNCQTSSKRSEYMLELMQYIEVDNYGTCGRNIRSLPEHIVKIQNSINKDLKDRGSYNWEEGKLALSSEYLFTIAIENSLNYDYITEKLWHSLVAGSVPIYLGAPNVEDWLPCKTNCIIDLRKFKTPKDAALYLKTIATNRTLYESFHQWRNEPISERFQHLLNYFETIRDYSLDCVLCDMSHRAAQGENPNEIKRKLTATIGRF